MAFVRANEWVPTLGLASLSLASAVTLLSTEAVAQGTTAPLPLTRRLLVSAKLSLVMGVYLLSVGAASAAAALSGKAAAPLALLAIAYAPAVAASAVTLSLTAYKISGSGAPPSDLYSRLAHMLLPILVGFLLLLTPALVYGLLWLLKHPAPLISLALTGTIELAIAVVALAASK